MLYISTDKSFLEMICYGWTTVIEWTFLKIHPIGWGCKDSQGQKRHPAELAESGRKIQEDQIKREDLFRQAWDWREDEVSPRSLNPDAHWVESGKGTIEVSKTGDTAYMRYDVVVEKFMSLAGWLQMHNIRFRVENYDFSQLEESYMEKYMKKA